MAHFPDFEKQEALRNEEESSYGKSDSEAESGVGADRARCRRWGAVSFILACTVGFSLVLPPIIGPRIAEAALDSLSISFSSIDLGTINGSKTMHPRIVGRVAHPSPFPAVLIPVKMLLKAKTAELEGGPEEMQAIGSVSVPEIRVRPFQEVALDHTVEVSVQDPQALGGAGRHFIAARRTWWVIEAEIAVKVWVLGIVPLELRGIRLRKPIELKGLGGFVQDVNPVTMQNVTSADGQPSALSLTVVVKLHNPSYITARIASGMDFEVAQRGQRFGTAHLDDLHLLPGPNLVPLRFVLTSTPVNEGAIRAFIQDYIKAKLQNVTVLGSEASTQDAMLSAILQGLSATFSFQPPPVQFLHGVEANIGLGVTATTNIFNPLPQAITMGNLDLSIRESNSFETKIFRLCTTDGSITNIPGAVLSPQQISTLKITLNPFDAKLTNLAVVGRLLDAAQEGRLVVGVNGPVTITIQPSFTLTVDYSADDITALIKCPFLCGR